LGLILQALEGEPLTRSKIMYQTMLNFKQATDYTGFLVQEGLLTYLMLDRKYAITDRGRRFLALFYETNRLLTIIDDDPPADGDNNVLVQNRVKKWRRY
jgi:predicted transcriptional regulator